jgi:hypothetical protein
MPDGVLSGDAPQVRAPLNLRILRKGIQTRVRASRVLDLAATLRVRKGAKGAKGSRAWAAFHRRPFCCWNDPDDWAVAGRAWAAVMARKQMFQKLIDFTVLVAAQFDVFLEGQISRAARLFGGLKGGNGFKPNTVKFFTRLICWHGRRNNTITGM